ncbi:hypothetical protein OIU76_000823, partial [Salix suchowensis]
MGGSGTLVNGVRRWFQRRSNNSNHTDTSNYNNSSGIPQSSVKVKVKEEIEKIEETEEQELTVIEDFDFSGLKLIRVPKRIHFPPGFTMDTQKK